ncbi:hypothetical protein ACQ4PT_036087 [Festuca glaucescens]
MADPSYLQSVTLSQETQFKEFLLHLYLYRNGQAQPEGNQVQILGSTSPHGFGCTVVNDWTMHDAPSPTATIVAHAQGLHLQASINGSNWFVCHNIVFIDDRFKGSTLKVLGNMGAEEGEWAIIGGTGEFAYAQGVVTYKPSGTAEVNRELHIRVLCLTFPKLAVGNTVSFNLHCFLKPLPCLPLQRRPLVCMELTCRLPVCLPCLCKKSRCLVRRSQPLRCKLTQWCLPLRCQHLRCLPQWCLVMVCLIILRRIGPWGGDNGRHFSMQGDLPQRLISVSISYGSVISLLEIAYYNQSGVERSASWGGRPLPGSQSEQMVLQPGELVKNVSGTTQFYDGSVRISSLTFVTTVRTYGPFGPEGSHSSFSSPELDDNSSIVGFFGQHTSFGSQPDAKNYVNSIGAYVLHRV